MSKRAVGFVIVALAMTLSGIAAAHEPAADASPPMGQTMPCGDPPMMNCPYHHGTMGRGGAMMGRGGGMGMMGMGELGPMIGPDVDVKVDPIADGVTITLTTSDPKEATRLQKRAEIMRLVHELRSE